ncbi:PREDICTED: protein disulfide-isomerase A6 [Myotis davidii]|uniref:protein disulfide-isomerase A6 n=1 Tax=Myotis davidii TaxID=225400 RepID=UPI0007672813|nr:PREDICTED: protein disulfide-isomerase A6 [Myotis davidii]
MSSPVGGLLVRELGFEPRLCVDGRQVSHLDTAEQKLHVRLCRAAEETMEVKILKTQMLCQDLHQPAPPAQSRAAVEHRVMAGPRASGLLSRLENGAYNSSQLREGREGPTHAVLQCEGPWSVGEAWPPGYPATNDLLLVLPPGLVSCTFFLTVNGLYSSSDDVIELTPSNFNQEVIQSNSLWFVEFFAPWCGHCQRLTPEWKKVATALKGVVKVGAVDADKHQSLGGQYGVQGFPTIKIFGSNKNRPEDYQGGRTADAIVDAALGALRQLVKDRLGGRGYSSGRQGRSESSSKKDVIELTDDNFDKNVLDSEDVWMVEFYAPWCGHCKNLEPEWAAAATEVKEQTKGKVKLAAVDATANQMLTGRYGIRGFPTIKIFQKGESPVDYDGGRTRSDIVSRALDLFSDNAPPPELLEIVSEDVAKKTCEEHQLCVVAVLPHILDTGAAGRNSYLEVLLKLADKYKKKMWGWLWTEAGAQSELENALGIGGFGYPAMAAINARKMKFALLKGSFSEQGINEFLRELSFGRGSTAPVGGGAFPTISTREPWDGKDGELPVEDDIDLSDVELDDLEKDEL